MTMLAVAGLLAGFGAWAQTAAPAFDVASVKALGAQGLPQGYSTTPHRSGGRVSWTTNFTVLAGYAFHLPTWRLPGVEKDTSFYTIEATFAPDASEDQLRLMFQKLLADRFKLASHRETREVQGYALVAAKSGPKIKPVASVSEEPDMPEYLKGKFAPALEGRIFVSMEGPGTSALTARGVGMDEVAESISNTLATAVTNQTGLNGKFYFGFKFQAQNNLTGEGDSVPLASAIQDALGLRLDKQKISVEFVIIEHLEKPSEN